MILMKATMGLPSKMEVVDHKEKLKVRIQQFPILIFEFSNYFLINFSTNMSSFLPKLSALELSKFEALSLNFPNTSFLLSASVNEQRLHL